MNAKLKKFLEAPFRGTSLRWKLIVSVAATHAVLMTLFVDDMVVRQQESLRTQVVERAHGRAQALAASSRSWVLANDLAGLEEVVLAQRVLPGLRYAMVLSPQGQVLAHTDATKVGLFVTDKVSLSLLGKQAVEVELMEDGVMEDIASPITMGDRHIGWARVGMDGEEQSRALSAVVRDGVLYALVAIAAGVLIAILISRGLLRDLDRILSLMQRTRNGERGLRVALPRHDEVGRLGDGFDSMIETMERSNQMYRLLSNVNTAIVRIHDPHQLYQRVCAAAVESGLFLMSWIGEVAEDGDTVLVSARAGRDDGYLDNVQIRLDHPVLGQGPTGTCIREDRYVINNNSEHNPAVAPWREGMLARGYYSSAAFPLHHEGRVYGAFMVYAAQPEFFDEAMVALLQELANDVTFALQFINESTKRNQAEMKLRELNAELEQRVRQRTQDLENVNRELEAFSYSVSHDLRAPLRSIDGFSGIVLRENSERLDERGREYLERVRAATRRMGLLIDDLLTLSRLSRTAVRREQVDLGALAHSIMEALAHETPSRQVETKIMPGMWVYGDPGLLRVALENLLGNAWKFSQGKPAAHIEFGRDEIQGEPVFYVRDNGAGFDMRYAEKMFGAFQRLHSDHEFPGTGIGLAIVQRIIYRHNGRIWAEARVGEGACFFFSLPQRMTERP